MFLAWKILDFLSAGKNSPAIIATPYSWHSVFHRIHSVQDVIELGVCCTGLSVGLFETSAEIPTWPWKATV